MIGSKDLPLASVCVIPAGAVEASIFRPIFEKPRNFHYSSLLKLGAYPRQYYIEDSF